MGRPLFTSHEVWSLESLPTPYDLMEARTSDLPDFNIGTLADLCGVHSKFASMNSYVVRAILALCGELPGVKETSILCLSQITGEMAHYGVEIDMENGVTYLATYFASVSTEKWELSACKFNPGETVPTQLASIPRRADLPCVDDLLAPYLALICVAGAIHESVADMVRAAMEEVRRTTSLNLKTSREKPFFTLSQAMYALVPESRASMKSTAQLVVDLDGDKISNMTLGFLRGQAMQDAEVVMGTAPFLRDDAAAVQASPTLTIAEAKKEFAAYIGSKTWTTAEEALIPEFPDDFPVPPESLKIARRFIATHEMRRPMVNFLWRGITSFGKSTGVEVIACLLHTPLLRMTCCPEMERQDFLSQFVPDNSPAFTGEVPTVEQIFFDPQSSYTAVTGEEKEDVTPDEVLKAIVERAAQNPSSAARFKHVESDFVVALSKGYICEVEEFSRIRNAGTLVGLNRYDQPGALIPLVDGSHVRRHKDAMVIYTDNVGYVSCRPVDPSVIRRMAFCIDSNKLSKSKVLERVVYNTGFANKAMLEVMYNTWTKMQKYCKNSGISEGPISVTELEMWAQAVLIDGYTNLYQNAVECMVAKATSDEAEQAEIKAAVLDPMLASQP